MNDQDRIQALYKEQKDWAIKKDRYDVVINKKLPNEMMTPTPAGLVRQSEIAGGSVKYTPTVGGNVKYAQ